jgi:hypothetical protein
MYFFDERLGIYYHAVANQAFYVGVKNPRRYQVQDAFFSADDHRVACIIAPLVAGHPICIVSEKIDDLPLTFISPLATNDDY